MKWLASRLHRIANRLCPGERWLPTPSMADETEAWRKQLQVEGEREFGPRIEFVSEPYTVGQLLGGDVLIFHRKERK